MTQQGEKSRSQLMSSTSCPRRYLQYKARSGTQDDMVAVASSPSVHRQQVSTVSRAHRAPYAAALRMCRLTLRFSRSTSLRCIRLTMASFVRLHARHRWIQFCAICQADKRGQTPSHSLLTPAFVPARLPGRYMLRRGCPRPSAELCTARGRWPCYCSRIWRSRQANILGTPVRQHGDTRCLRAGPLLRCSFSTLGWRAMAMQARFVRLQLVPVATHTHFKNACI